MRALTMDEVEVEVVGGIRELTAEEIDHVSGGMKMLGIRITGIAAGLELAEVGGALGASFGAGYWVGGYIYEGIAWSALRYDWW